MKPIKMEQIWPLSYGESECLVCDATPEGINTSAIGHMLSIMGENPEGRKLRVTFDNGQVCTYKERQK